MGTGKSLKKQQKRPVKLCVPYSKENLFNNPNKHVTRELHASRRIRQLPFNYLGDHTLFTIQNLNSLILIWFF